MSEHVESTSPIFDMVKQIIAALIVVGGVFAFYHFSEFPLLYRVFGLVVDVIIAIAMLLTTETGRGVWIFVNESKQEVRKVVWPTREETFRTTLMVFIMVIVVGLLLWFLDMFLFWGVRLLTGQEG